MNRQRRTAKHVRWEKRELLHDAVCLVGWVRGGVFTGYRFEDTYSLRVFLPITGEGALSGLERNKACSLRKRGGGGCVSSEERKGYLPM